MAKRRKKIPRFNYTVFTSAERKPYYGLKKLRGYAVKTAWKKVAKRHKWCTHFFKRGNPLLTIKRVQAAEQAYPSSSRLGNDTIGKIMTTAQYKRSFARRRPKYIRKARRQAVRRAPAAGQPRRSARLNPR